METILAVRPENSNIIERSIVDGKTFSSEAFRLIDSAQSEICLSTYIFADDSFGAEVFAKLEEKAKAGVKIRFLVDGFGSLPWLAKKPLRKLPESFHARVYHPFPSLFQAIMSFNLRSLIRFVKFLSNANRRNHQKLLISDGKEFIFGSRNFHEQALRWRETSVVSSQPTCKDLQMIFDDVWKKVSARGFKRIKLATQSYTQGGRVLSTHTHSLRDSRNRRVLDLIHRSESRIWITTPYFFPPWPVFKALKERAKEGVDVRIILPNQFDVLIYRLIGRLQYHDLMTAGVKVHEYQAGLLHAKTMICDEQCLVGSGNLNRRSFIRDLELDLLSDNAHFVQEIAQQFQLDMQDSIQLSKTPKLSLKEKFLGSLFRFLFPTWF